MLTEMGIGVFVVGLVVFAFATISGYVLENIWARLSEKEKKWYYHLATLIKISRLIMIVGGVMFIMGFF